MGNFIADFVKGRKKDGYPDGIRLGIELHRGIDDFTDHHPLAVRSRHRLQTQQGKYAGVVIDLVYDHFLARLFPEYSTVSLEEFSLETYGLMHGFAEILPEDFRFMLRHMEDKNWLTSYATLDGFDRAATGLSRRVSFPNRMHEARHDVQQAYAELEGDFREFFPAVQGFASAWLVEKNQLE